MSHVVWTGQPFVYPREEGHGLIIQQYHYRFDKEGRLERMDLLTQPVLDMLLTSQYPNDQQRAMAIAAFATTPQLRQARKKREEADQIRSLVQKELETQKV